MDFPSKYYTVDEMKDNPAIRNKLELEKRERERKRSKEKLCFSLSFSPR